MATIPKSTNPLDSLQLLLNDALVQTGKALRASRRDENGNLIYQGALQSKLPDTANAFHAALDDLDHNIIQAKSVLLRDLKQLRAKQASASATSQQPPAEPEPVLAQTKSPMAIDIGSSPPTAPAPAPAPEAAPEIKAEPAAETIDITSGTEDNKIDLEASLAGLTDTNFTDMEFAPPSEPTTFDMASFAPTDNATDLLSLENLMPAAGDGNTAPTDTTTTAAAAPSTSLDAEFADLFDNNDGQADGMDFDFSIGGGAGGTGGGGGGDDTFDDLMNTRGEDSFGMGGDDFDASFFGLDKPEGT